MLSPRGQAGLEAKILSLALDSASKNCPRPRPRTFWPRENECNDGTGNYCAFAVIIYKVVYLLTLCYWYKLVQVHVHGSI